MCPPGCYHLLLLAPAYTAKSAPNSVWDEARIINVAAGETIEGQDFKFARGGVITGRVTNADGKPVIGEYLRLTDASQQNSDFANNYAVSPYAFETDDRGVYRLYGLPAGRYRVAVGEDATSGRAVGAVLSGKNFTRTFHPNTTDPAQAKIVEVSPGTEATGVDITLAAPLKTYEATGRIVDALTNQPVPNIAYGFGVVNPEAKYIGSQGWGGTKTNADGEFRLRNLLPGHYAVLIIAWDTTAEAANYYGAPTPFEIVDGDVDGLQMKIQRGATLSGVAVIEGTPANRAALAKLAEITVNVNVIPAAPPPQSDELQRGAQGARARLQPGGGFRFIGLSPGRAQIALEPYSTPKGFTLLRIERAGVVVEPRKGIEIGAGEQMSGVRLVLAYGVGVVRGQMEVQQDGAPASLPAGARVGVSWRRKDAAPSPRGERQVEVDARGRFVLDGLIAGEYELTARGWIPPTPDAPHGVPLTSVTQNVNVPEAGEVNVTLVYHLPPKPQGDTP